MEFYGIRYLKSLSSINDYLKYFFIFAVLFVLVIVFSLYLRYRIQTKYRDLSIIFLLLLIFVTGVQYSDYQSNQKKYSQNSQMVNFVQDISKEKNIDQEKILVNSTQLTDGIIIKLEKKYYLVNLSMDQSSYTLTPVYLMSNNIVVNN